VALTDNRVEISVDGAAPAIVATWNAGGGMTATSDGGDEIGDPLRPYLLLTEASIAGFDPIALTVLDWGSLVTILDLEGADPDGNDPAPNAEMLPDALRFLQRHPPVLRMEINDLSTALSEAMVAEMDVIMNDREVIDYHHYELCHLGEQFFTKHDEFVDDMEAHLIGADIELPFGRMPFWEPGGQIPDAYAVWSDIAEDFYATEDACDTYPPRICVPEENYIVKFSTPEVVDQYPCNPANQATWCEGLLQNLACSDEIGTPAEDYMGCEDDDMDGLPDGCPYALLPRFQSDAICDYETVDHLWSDAVDWHGQTHDRVGGAHGDHNMTASTPIFWLFHVTLGAVYEGYLRCP
jgi:hypothetical protein